MNNKFIVLNFKPPSIFKNTFKNNLTALSFWAIRECKNSKVEKILKGDGIKSRLSSYIFSTLHVAKDYSPWCSIQSWLFWLHIHTREYLPEIERYKNS